MENENDKIFISLQLIVKKVHYCETWSIIHWELSRICMCQLYEEIIQNKGDRAMNNISSCGVVKKLHTH